MLGTLAGRVDVVIGGFVVVTAALDHLGAHDIDLLALDAWRGLGCDGEEGGVGGGGGGMRLRGRDLGEVGGGVAVTVGRAGVGRAGADEMRAEGLAEALVGLEGRLGRGQ